jgi:hypothetical protein
MQLNFQMTRTRFRCLRQRRMSSVLVRIRPGGPVARALRALHFSCCAERATRQAKQDSSYLLVQCSVSGVKEEPGFFSVDLGVAHIRHRVNLTRRRRPGSTLLREICSVRPERQNVCQKSDFIVRFVEGARIGAVSALLVSCQSAPGSGFAFASRPVPCKTAV